MRDLDAGHHFLRLHELGDALERRDVRGRPNSEVAVGDAALVRHRGGLDEHAPRAAQHQPAPMREVEVLGDAVDRRVGGHGGDDDAVLEGHVADGDGREEQRLGHWQDVGLVGVRRRRRDAERSRLHAALSSVAISLAGLEAGNATIRRPRTGKSPGRKRRPSARRKHAPSSRPCRGPVCGWRCLIRRLPRYCAQEYPDKPITLIVPWPAGGSTDIAMRAIAEAASKDWASPSSSTTRPAAAARVGPADHGGRRQARRLHHRADADHRVPPAADAGSVLGSGSRISPTSSISPATPSASPPAPSDRSRPGRT